MITETTDVLTYNHMNLGLLTEEELAGAFQIEVNTLRVWRREEKGPPYVKIGRTTFYRTDDVETWLSFFVRVPTETKIPHPYLHRYSNVASSATGSRVVTGPVSNLPFTGDNAGVKL
jgi:hypothetical protein